MAHAHRRMLTGLTTIVGAVSLAAGVLMPTALTRADEPGAAGAVKVGDTARERSAEELEDERRAVEAWVRADIERAARFYKSEMAPVHYQMVVETEIAASEEEKAARLERLASLGRAIEGKPDHPFRREYFELKYSGPGSTYLSTVDLWLGTWDGTLAWRESWTNHVDAPLSILPDLDQGIVHGTRWHYIENGSYVTLKNSSPDVGNGTRRADLNLLADVLFGWSGVFSDHYLPSSITVTPAPDDKLRSGETDWSVQAVYGSSANTVIQLYRVLWNAAQNRGYLASRTHEWEFASVKLMRQPASKDFDDWTLPVSVTDSLISRGETKFAQTRRISSINRTPIDAEEFARSVLIGVGKQGEFDTANEPDPLRAKLPHAANYVRGTNSQTVEDWTAEKRNYILGLKSKNGNVELPRSTVNQNGGRWQVWAWSLAAICLILIAYGGMKKSSWK